MRLRRRPSVRTARPNPATYVLHADGTVTVLGYGPQVR